ncbi:methylmalonyl Co-A mutase-associated GTPase MeaB [Solemya velesiana gill symbiont]|uniref:ATPase/protein kinase n=1 Tax=Solemya velesiana gill symbiont TaxID=1918948 RepID=A0A1T2KYH7_9GAMM|nr:methylmalonyl Co-A mutase-associated GTPase MeaB [Solemya velesiana gill symbiont]OOZ37883.1 ATPase/protein kinase [Solemya velesiana gill symbiont]
MSGQIEELAEQVLAGNRRVLSRAITLVESTRGDHREQATALLQRLSPHAGNSVRIGISGVPGVGKSTFIEALGMHILGKGRRLAVLAVDPTSALTGGSILGDKTRMEELSRQRGAFIRPSPAGSTLGGVARRTRETMLLCEAAGFDVVIVETVGVGQSKTAVADMTDMFLLLLLPGGGDDLQGIKRGIMELADLILVNKADGDMASAANLSASDYLHALKLLHPRTRNWKVPVKTCSALKGRGIPEAWELIGEYRNTLGESGELEERRATQAKAWMWSETAENLVAVLRDDDCLKQRIPKLEREVMEGRIPATLAAAELLELFLSKKSS